MKSQMTKVQMNKAQAQYTFVDGKMVKKVTEADKAVLAQMWDASDVDITLNAEEVDDDMLFITVKR